MKKKFPVWLPLLALSFFAGIMINSNSGDKPANNPATDSLAMLNDQMSLAVLYHQQSGEYRALCYQGFRTATMMLKADLAVPSVPSPKAVVLDIDETVLDNSPYEAASILQNVTYPALWNEWCGKAIAKPIPGALEFLQFAQSNGVQIFYITNRDEKLRNATVKNLKQCGFPAADDRHLIMRKDVSSKEFRRKQVAAKYHISVLVGDNLNDFTDAFEKKSVGERIIFTDSLRQEFGKKFIVIPNPMYGDWESALFQYDYKKSAGIRWQTRRYCLKGF